jgi:foldase protein PrsA
MKRLRLILVLGLLVALSASACGETFESSAAVVGGKEISVSDVDEAVEEFRDSAAFETASAGGGGDIVLKEFERSYLGLLIRIAILETEAEGLDISVTDADVEARIDEIKGEFENEAAFQDALAQQGLTLPALRQYVYQSELEGQVRAAVTGDTTVDPAAVQEYYDEHLDEFTQVRSSHILVEDNETAIGIAEQLAEANPDEVDDLFADLAKEQSIDTTSGASGGDLGFSTYGEFVQPFAEALRDLEVGEISGPVRSEFGDHIIFLKARRVTPFLEVEEQITGQLFTEQQDSGWLEWVTERYEAAELEVNPRYGEFDPETQQVVAATDFPGAETPLPNATPNPEIAPSPQG